jgi:putative PIN family toxin of toxin-antitoxin system
MRANRFVLDVNIWVSYFISLNHEWLLRTIYENEITVFSCSELSEELERVLKYEHLKKYKISVREAIRIVEAATCKFQITYPLKNYIPADPADNYVIALALQTNSGFVTSGDHHILEEKEKLEKKFSKLKIITKAEFESMSL